MDFCQRFLAQTALSLSVWHRDKSMHKMEDQSSTRRRDMNAAPLLVPFFRNSAGVRFRHRFSIDASLPYRQSIVSR